MKNNTEEIKKNKEYHSADEVFKEYLPMEYLSSEYDSMPMRERHFGKKLVEKYIRKIEDSIEK
jgi:hypothetical protein